MARHLVLVLVLALASIVSPAHSADAPYLGTFGLDEAHVDRSIAPGDDFAEYVNGKWYASAQIPADRSWWGEVPRLVETAATRVRAIDEAAMASPATPDQKKFGDYFASYLDEAAIEAKGTVPIQPDLAMVRAIRTPHDLAIAIARLDRRMAPPQFGQTQSSFPVSFGVNIDPKQPTAYVAEIDQGGLGLPDKDYYTNPDPQVAQMPTSLPAFHAGRI